jgi:hypothetical protein
VSRESDAMLPGQAEQFAKKLAPLVDKQMESAAAAANPSALFAYRQASEFYRRGAQPFNDAGVRAIMRKDPEAVARYLIPLSGNLKVTTLQAIHAASKGDPGAIEALRGHYVAELFRASAKSEGVDTIVRAGHPSSGAYVSGDRLLKLLNQDTAGLNALLGRKGANELRSLAAAIAHAEKRPGALGDPSLGTYGKFLRIGVPAGSMLSLSVGGPELGAGAATTIFFAPNVLNRMLASRSVRRWLIGGDSPPPGSRTATQAVGQILSHALAIGREHRGSVRIVNGSDVPTEQPGPLRVPQEALR